MEGFVWERERKKKKKFDITTEFGNKFPTFASKHKLLFRYIYIYLYKDQVLTTLKIWFTQPAGLAHDFAGNFESAGP